MQPVPANSDDEVKMKRQQEQQSKEDEARVFVCVFWMVFFVGFCIVCNRY